MSAAERAARGDVVGCECFDDLVVVIPAHNEEDVIGETLESLARQTLLPGRVLVAADNCDDGTALIAFDHGADVLVTENNRDRKAGALNQAIARFVEPLPKYLLVLDADTRISPDFTTTAIALLEADPLLGAVSGLFVGDRPQTLLEQFQANEYARYRTQILTTGRVAVVTGTASVFRLEALNEVAAARGTRLPGTPGDVYDRTAITEDSELTLALKTLGWRAASDPACACVTELMPTWGDLHRQRVRWYKGMLDNLRSYGLNRTTARYFGQQLMIVTGILTIAVLTALTMAALATGTFTFRPFWLAVGGVFVLNRVVTVWPVGARGRWLALALLPEIAYDMALQATFVRAAYRALTRRDFAWNHVQSGQVSHRSTEPRRLSQSPGAPGRKETEDVRAQRGTPEPPRSDRGVCRAGVGQFLDAARRGPRAPGRGASDAARLRRPPRSWTQQLAKVHARSPPAGKGSPDPAPLGLCAMRDLRLWRGRFVVPTVRPSEGGGQG